MTDIMKYENYNLMNKKIGVIMGVANADSIAWHIALNLHANGAKVIITYQETFKRWLEPLAAQIDAIMIPCEVTNDQSIEDCVKAIKEITTQIDFFVYGPAFANKEELKGQYLKMNRDNFAQSLDISCYSMIPIVNKLQEMMKPGASVLALSYHGSQKVIPCYDLMGVAKAALEASVRYLAYYLGPQGVRVNSLSAGPVRTLAASRGIKGYNCLEEYYQKNAPMLENITVQDVAKSALYLLSDMSSGVTAENHYVDKGYNAMGVKNPNTDDVDLSVYRKS